MAMQISRRNFVAGAATVGAMAAFGMAGCSSKGSGKAESKAEEYDIVIVGAGGAGMSAAIAAHDAGVEKVVVLEKEGNVGLSRSLCKSFHRNLSILALMPSSHSSWLRTRAQPGWWHPSPHLEYSSFTRR